MLEKSKILYEILLRFGPEGFRGAHVMDCEIITEDGVLKAEVPGAPRPCTLEEVGIFLGDKNAELLECVQTETSRAAEAIDQADAVKNEAAAVVASAEQERDAALAKLQAARQALAALDA